MAETFPAPNSDPDEITKQVNRKAYQRSSHQLLRVILSLTSPDQEIGRRSNQEEGQQVIELVPRLKQDEHPWESMVIIAYPEDSSVGRDEPESVCSISLYQTLGDISLELVKTYDLYLQNTFYHVYRQNMFIEHSDADVDFQTLDNYELADTSDLMDLHKTIEKAQVREVDF